MTGKPRVSNCWTEMHRAGLEKRGTAAPSSFSLGRKEAGDQRCSGRGVTAGPLGRALSSLLVHRSVCGPVRVIHCEG